MKIRISLKNCIKTLPSLFSLFAVWANDDLARSLQEKYVHVIPPIERIQQSREILEKGMVKGKDYHSCLASYGYRSSLLIPGSSGNDRICLASINNPREKILEIWYRPEHLRYLISGEIDFRELPKKTFFGIDSQTGKEFKDFGFADIDITCGLPGRSRILIERNEDGKREILRPRVQVNCELSLDELKAEVQNAIYALSHYHRNFDNFYQAAVMNACIHEGLPSQTCQNELSLIHAFWHKKTLVTAPKSFKFKDVDFSFASRGEQLDRFESHQSCLKEDQIPTIACEEAESLYYALSLDINHFLFSLESWEAEKRSPRTKEILAKQLNSAETKLAETTLFLKNRCGKGVFNYNEYPEVVNLIGSCQRFLDDLREDILFEDFELAEEMMAIINEGCPFNVQLKRNPNGKVELLITRLTSDSPFQFVQKIHRTGYLRTIKKGDNFVSIAVGRWLIFKCDGNVALEQVYNENGELLREFSQEYSDNIR